MCRHFAWLGRDRSFDELILQPSYGLARQAARPRWQHIDLVNRDGFGVGWFPSEGHAVTYRRTGTIEEDRDFPALAREMSGGCVLGSVRGASPGMPIEVAATAPFTDGTHLLSLNGHLNVEQTEHLLEPGRKPESTCDAAFLAALLWQRLERGGPLDLVVEELVREISALDSNACLNLLVTDGVRVVATTWGETLCYRVHPDGVIIASEPHDDDLDAWIPVEDRHVIVGDAFGVHVRPLEPAPEAVLGPPVVDDGILA